MAVMLLLTIATCLSLYFRGVTGWALPWIATSYYEQHVTTIITATTFTYISVTYTDLIRTDIVNVIPTVTPVSTLTIVTTIDKYYSDFTIVEVLVPTGAGTSIDIYSIGSTMYYVQLFYTAPSTCKSAWVFSTTAYVNAPAGVTFAATSTSTIYTQYKPFGPTSTKFYAFVNPTDIPIEHLSSLSSMYAPFYSSRCYGPTTTKSDPTATRPADSGTGIGSAANWAGCTPFVWYFAGIEAGRGYICDDGIHYTSGISLPVFVVAWIFSWLGFFLIVGLIESYVTFSRLARGLKARRGVPVAFACLLPLLSCVLLCFSSRGYWAKSPEEQAYLTTQWRGMPLSTRLRWWLVWGFRRKYPPFLGAPPPSRSAQGGDPNPAPSNAPEVVSPEAVKMHSQMQQQQVPGIPAEMEQPYRYHELQSPDGGNYVIHEKPSY